MRLNFGKPLPRILVTITLISLLAGCGGITMKLYDSAGEQFKKSLGEYDKSHYLKAIDGFEKVVFNFSGASMVDSAQYYLAMSHYRMKDYYMAASEFERLVTYYPGSPFVDDAQYMMGFCHFRAAPGHYGLDQSELILAIEAFEDFETDYPESDLAGEAGDNRRTALARLARKKYESGRIYFRLGYYKSANIYFQMVLDEFTDSEWAARALYYQGEIEFKEKRFQEAQQKFNNFILVFPDHDYAKKAEKMLSKIDGNLADSTEEN